MEQIGKRIFIEKTEKNIRIEIIPTADNLKRNLLIGWLLIWSVLGIVVASQYFLLQDPNQKTLVIVYLGFWIYYEYKVGKTWRWRTSGKEVIEMKEDIFSLSKLVSGKGKEEIFEIQNIHDLHLFEGREKGFFKSLNNSYWAIGIGSLAFEYEGKEIKFGLQLEDEEAKQLMKQIKYNLKK